MLDLKNMKETDTNVIVDNLAEVLREQDVIKVKADILKAELQRRGVAILEDRNIKYTEFYGNENTYAGIGMNQSFDLVNYFRLQELLGKEFLEDKIKRVPEINYTIDAKFKKALIAIFTKEYEKNQTLEEFLDKTSFELDDKQKKLLLKKLKGEYKKDKDTIQSVIGKTNIDLDTELYYIYLIKNWELILMYFDVDKVDSLIEEVRKCIAVEETVKITPKYDKNIEVA